MPPQVSVIIVNYNGLGFLEECLRSVADAFVRYIAEVIVVDNASTDGSEEFLRRYNGIRLIESQVNTGFTGGNNLGASRATGDYLLLLNNDTRVETNLDPLIDLIAEPAVGAAGCRLRYDDGRQQFSVGYEHTPLRLVVSWLGLEKYHWFPVLFRRRESDPSFYQSSHRSVDWVSGACLATRRDVWNRLAGFDDEFFMYCEDVDYCRRVRLAGLRVEYSADAVVTHFEGAGKTWIGEAALRRSARSYWVYCRKHFGFAATFAMVIGLAGVFLVRAIYFSVRAFGNSEATQRRVRLEKGRAFARTMLMLLMLAVGGKAARR